MNVKDHIEIQNIRIENSRIRDALQISLLYVSDFSSLLPGPATFPHLRGFVLSKINCTYGIHFRASSPYNKFYKRKKKGLPTLCIRATHFGHMKYKKKHGTSLIYCFVFQTNTTARISAKRVLRIVNIKTSNYAQVTDSAKLSQPIYNTVLLT
jgi:hypothetical protein